MCFVFFVVKFLDTHLFRPTPLREIRIFCHKFDSRLSYSMTQQISQTGMLGCRRDLSGEIGSDASANNLMMAELPMMAECPSATGQFEELYALYHDSIYRYLYRLVDKSDLAGDLAHDVFIQLHRQLAGNLQLRNPRAWLYSVATNLGYNHLRREQRLVRLIRDWLPLLDRTTSPEREYVREEQRKLARQVIGRLPVREQILLQLFQDGLSYADIAVATNLNPSSVGKLLARAIAKCARSVKR